MEPIICYTVNDRALCDEVNKLRRKLEPGRQFLCWLLPPITALLLAVFLWKKQMVLSVVFGAALFLSLMLCYKLYQMHKRDADGLHRKVTVTENEIIVDVQESGNSYQFYREDIQAAEFSDKAAVLYFPAACVALWAQGVENDAYPQLREQLESLTAERTSACRRSVLGRSICTAIVLAVAVAIGVLAALGIIL